MMATTKLLAITLAAICLAPSACAQAIGGYTFDANYTTLTAACSAAGSGTLVISKPWNSLTTATYACNMLFLAGGDLQPGSAQTVTISGAISAPTLKIFDISLGGSLVISGSLVVVPIQWFGG